MTLEEMEAFAELEQWRARALEWQKRLLSVPVSMLTVAELQILMDLRRLLKMQESDDGE